MVQLDWKAYYLAFRETHGIPVIHKGVQLFPDGWTYSARDYAGPEWPPPENVEEHRLLMCTYWLKRLRMVQDELRSLELDVHTLEEMQRVRYVPLQEVVKYKDDSGKLVVKLQELDVSPLKERIAWLRDDRDACKARLAEMEQASRRTA